MGALLLAALLSTAAPEPAEQRVTIVAASPDDPLVTALQGELGTLGLRAETFIDDDPDVTWSELREVAKGEGVVAAVWISPDRGEVVIWVDDRGKGRAIVRELPAAEGEDADEVIVLRAVELLRASLREVQERADEASAQEDPPSIEPDPPPPAKLTRPRWFIDLGPALAGAPGGLGLSVHVAGSVRFMPHRIIGVRLAALAPTVGPKVVDTEGSARVSIAQLVAGPHVAFRQPDTIVQPDAGLGLGVSIVRLDGRAADPFVGATDHVVGFTARLTAGVAFVVHRALAIRIDGFLGATAPSPQIAFGPRVVARWGQPYGGGVLALEARFGHR